MNHHHSENNEHVCERGVGLLEALIAAAILTFALVAIAGNFSSNLLAVSTVNRMDDSTRFVSETLDSLGSQSFDNLLGMNGNSFFDQANAANARFRIDMTATENTVDLLTISLKLFDQKTGRLLSNFVTQRSRR